MTQFAILLLFVFILINMFNYYLEILNLKWMLKNGSKVPNGFENYLDQSLVYKMQNYTLSNSKFGVVESLFGEIILVVFIFGGLLDKYNNWIVSLDLHFVFAGILFFIAIMIVSSFISIPFSLYSTFKLEKKFEFNKATPKIWILDFIKSLTLSVVFMSILIGVALLLVNSLPNSWWIATWFFFLVFSIFIMFISPYVLEPLFNDFKPLEDEELDAMIKEKCEQTGIHVDKIFQMDASKRTTHTNAYFSGIGKAKRIVLYDTLLEKLDKKEIVAVLAHEMGHWKKKHVFKNIVVLEIFSLVFAYFAFLVISNNYLIDIFSITEETFFVKAILFFFVSSIILFPFSPMMNILSRKFEREADDFAAELMNGGDELASALIKLSKDNLSNLYPHPFYAKLHYSHPPVVERVNYLKEKS